MLRHKRLTAKRWRGMIGVGTFAPPKFSNNAIRSTEFITTRTTAVAEGYLSRALDRHPGSEAVAGPTA
jgi:hypothetical protein